MGDVLQPLEMLGPEGVQAEIKNLEFQYTLKGETLENVHQHHILVFALVRPWNRRPTLTKLLVKRIPPWASLGGT